MNSSSSTKTTLNSNNADITPPDAVKLTVGRVWFAVILTVVVFTSLVKLGFWQWERGEQKLRLESQLQQRQEALPVAFSSLELQPPNTDEASYYRWIGVPVQADFYAQGTLFYLDNQVFEGQVGYLVLQLVKVKSAGMALVELGFVAAPQDRQQLPVVNAFPVSESDQSVAITGRLYSKQRNRISQQTIESFASDNAGAYQRFRIQSLDMDSLSQLIEQSITPWVIQPTDSSGSHPHPWKPINMHSSKHFGYAFQWFVMAIVFAILVAYCSIRVWKQNTGIGSKAK